MTPLLANQPPAPQMVLALLAVLPAMALLTYVSGGYGIMQDRVDEGGKRGLPGGCTLAVVVGLVVLAGTHEGFGALVTLLFALHALIRGLWLALCGVRALRPAERRPTWLSEALPARLIPAGLITTAVAVAAGGAAVAFAGYWPGESAAVWKLRAVVEIEIAEGRLAAGVDGAPRFPDFANRPAAIPGTPGRPVLFEAAPGGGRRAAGRIGHFALEATVAPDGRSFEVLMTPDRYPFPPYNHLVTLSSFRADETGKVRSIPCTGRGRPCPPDAPVAFEVREDNVDDWLKRLREARAVEGPEGPAAPTSTAAPPR